MKIKKEDLYNLIEEELDGTLEESFLDYIPGARRLQSAARVATGRDEFVAPRILRPSAYYDDPAGISGVDPSDPTDVALQGYRPGLFFGGYAPAEDVFAAQERGLFADIARDYNLPADKGELAAIGSLGRAAYDPIRRNIKTAGILIPAAARGMYDQARDAVGGMFGGGGAADDDPRSARYEREREAYEDLGYDETGTPPAPSAPGSITGSGPRRTPTAPAAPAPAAPAAPTTPTAPTAPAEPPGVVGYRGPRRQIVRAMAADALGPGLPSRQDARRARQVARQAVRRKGKIEYSPIGRNVKRVMITPDELQQALQEALEEELRSLN